MKLLGVVFPLSLLAIQGQSQSTESDPGLLTLTGSISTVSGSGTTINDGDIPTGSITYLSYTSTETLSMTQSRVTGNGTDSVSTGSSTTVTLSLVGGTSANGTATGTRTSTAATATNTQPCNSYPEFCSRKYSNITMVAAHNSPFVKKGNAASNQQLDVTYQLNDGIRMLQGQTHYENDTLWFCHTSCNLLNVGTVQDYLTTVYDWVVRHPYDVVTILLGNSDNVDPTLYETPIQASGLGRFAYVPPEVPMALDDWPVLSDMILTQKRVVFFLDYNANQTAVPYLLDEFSQLWETPFSPTNTSFPCTVQRPPGLGNSAAKTRMYMANHNLNTEVKIGSVDILIPNTAELNETNAVSGPSSLGAMADECRDDWDRAPNFLLVDYYNIPNGTVFEVAADMNNVTYTGTCCGTTGQSGASAVSRSSAAMLSLALFIASSISIFS